MTTDLAEALNLIRLLETELNDEREGNSERIAAGLRVLDEIMAQRADPASVIDLATSAKNLLRNGWV